MERNRNVTEQMAENRPPREEYNTLVIRIVPYDFHTLGRHRAGALVDGPCDLSERNVLPYLIATNHAIRLSPYHPPGFSRRWLPIIFHPAKIEALRAVPHIRWREREREIGKCRGLVNPLFRRILREPRRSWRLPAEIGSLVNVLINFTRFGFNGAFYAATRWLREKGEEGIRSEVSFSAIYPGHPTGPTLPYPRRIYSQRTVPSLIPAVWSGRELSRGGFAQTSLAKTKRGPIQ